MGPSHKAKGDPQTAKRTRMGGKDTAQTSANRGDLAKVTKAIKSAYAAIADHIDPPGPQAVRMEAVIHLHCAVVKAECFGFEETAQALRDMQADLLRDVIQDR